MNFRYLKISLTEDFPTFRLIIAAFVTAFAVTVTVYKHIDLSDSVSASFSAPETIILTLTDMINRVFIFLPLYIFVISGAKSTDLGNTGVIMQRSRPGLVTLEIIKVLFYTLIFFVILLIIVLATSNAAFPQAEDFTRTFFGASSSYGISSDVLRGTPLTAVVNLFTSMFLTYFTIGIINMFLSFMLKEEAAFVLTVIIGILSEILITAYRIPLSLSACAVFILASFLLMNKKNL
ncbi:MAG: hypothetical protein LBL98_04005 [Ruminococcus sp.]|jgi:hypothetical protein|nr:hypothetical protein [Ruminococcus sp.]